ncbi:MAG TPA: hypothetical protein PKK15_02720, partial [Kouleothrix sp.]|nr:hypothetical protein [Kouleothrix sp.]
DMSVPRLIEDVERTRQVWLDEFAARTAAGSRDLREWLSYVTLLRQAGRVLAALPNCGAPQPLSVTLDLPAGWTWLELASVEPASNPADFGYPAGDPIAVGVSSVMFSP